MDPLAVPATLVAGLADRPPRAAGVPVSDMFKAISEQRERNRQVERKVLDRASYVVWRSLSPWRFLPSAWRARLFPRAGRRFRLAFRDCWREWLKQKGVTSTDGFRFRHFPTLSVSLEAPQPIDLEDLERFVRAYMASPPGPEIMAARLSMHIASHLERYAARHRRGWHYRRPKVQKPAGLRLNSNPGRHDPFHINELAPLSRARSSVKTRILDRVDDVILEARIRRLRWGK